MNFMQVANNSGTKNRGGFFCLHNLLSIENLYQKGSPKKSAVIIYP